LLDGLVVLVVLDVVIQVLHGIRDRVHDFMRRRSRA
jgi:hypothetical protein